MKNKVGMIRCLFFLGILFFTFAVTNHTAKAGDIDLAEADLIEFLHGTFEHEGSTYKVKAEYINQAKAYMMREDINLTNDDKSQAISMFYQNIEQGINEGYMELISSDSKSETNSEEKKQTEKKDSKDQAEDGDDGEKLGTESNSKENETEDKKDTDNENHSDQSDGEIKEDFLGLGITLTVEGEVSEIKNENSNQTESNETPGENNEVIDEEAGNDGENSSESGEQNESNGNQAESSIRDSNMIKKTGFNHAPMKWILMILGGCYLVLVSAVVYQRIAAKQNDSD